MFFFVFFFDTLEFRYVWKFFSFRSERHSFFTMEIMTRNGKLRLHDSVKEKERENESRARASEIKKEKDIKANKSIGNVNLTRVLLFLEHCFVLFVLYSKIHSFCYFFSKAFSVQATRQNKNYNV